MLPCLTKTTKIKPSYLNSKTAEESVLILLTDKNNNYKFIPKDRFGQSGRTKAGGPKHIYVCSYLSLFFVFVHFLWNSKS